MAVALGLWSEPVVTPPPSDTVAQKIAAIVLQQNNKEPYINGALVNPLKGTVIHSIDATTASLIGSLIETAAKKYTIPIPYLMASLCIESLFDPNCQNGNFAGSNPTKDPAGYDMGIAQIKLKYLVGNDGIATVDEAQAFALDPAKAIPYMASLLDGKIQDATQFITTLPPTINAAYQNPFLVAAAMYNFGLTGAEQMIASNPPIPHHCTMVGDMEKAFAASLGMQPVMP